MTGFNNPLVGGGGSLVYPQIKSPNFNQATGTGWAILKNGQAFFFSLTLQGGNIVLFGSNGEILIYSGTPAAGNLVIAIAGAAGVDSFGNTWSAGEQIGIAGQGQLIFQPNVGQSVKIGGQTATVQASLTGNTTDVNQSQGSLFAPVLINPGASQIMGQIMTSPLLASGGMGLVLQSAADDASAAAKISLCSVSVSSGTATFTSIVDVAPNVITIHATSGASQTIVLLTSGTSYTTPANMPATILCEAFGATGGGGGGGGTISDFSAGGGASGGGEYAAEPALAITSTTMYTYAIATGGSAGTGSSGGTGGTGGAASGNTTFTGDTHTVTAHPGQPGTGGQSGSAGLGGSGGTGGTGSANSTHHDGGNGGGGGVYDGIASGGGGGGGSSAGTTATGNNGSSSSQHLGASGGSAPIGGTSGGNGSNGGGSGVNGSAGHAGGIPGGGGGGGGGGGPGAGVSGGNGGAGTRGLVRLTFTQTTSTAQTVTVQISTGGNLTFTGTDTNIYQTGRATVFSTGNPFTTSSTNLTNVTGLSVPVGIGTYTFRCYLNCSIAVANTITFQFTAPSLTSSVWGGLYGTDGTTSTGYAGASAITSPLAFTPPGTARSNCIIEGSAVFAGTGTLQLQVKVGGSTISINQGSYMEVLPCS